MTNYSVNNVDEFIIAAQKEAQPHLKEIRTAVKSALPKAEEKIGYGKPYYKYHGWIVGFDTYTNHIGFEIYYGRLQSEDRAKLEEKGYKTGNKTFQIRYDQKVPIAMIKKISRAQAKLNQAKAKSKNNFKPIQAGIS